MTPRYVLSPEAAHDLVQIWLYIRQQGSEETANQVEKAIRDRMAFLSSQPDAGHFRKDLSDAPVKFFPVYSYLIVYKPGTQPLQVVAVLHGRRDIPPILEQR